jgi:hypothetical protein
VTYLDPDDDCEEGFTQEGLRFPGRITIAPRDRAVVNRGCFTKSTLKYD